MSDTTTKRPLQAVIFDMDGLIFDSERIVQLSWDIAGERLGYGKLGANIYHTLGMNVARRKAYFAETYGSDFPFDTFRSYSRLAFREYVEQNGLPMKPGLTELLDFLHTARIRTAVATSSSHDYAIGNLTSAGLASSFDGFLSGNTVTHGKPAPEIYDKACRLIHVPASQAIALEDSPNGIRSAHAAGLIPIMIPDLIREAPEIEPLLDAKLLSLSDVIPYIQKYFSY